MASRDTDTTSFAKSIENFFWVRLHRGEVGFDEAVAMADEKLAELD